MNRGGYLPAIPLWGFELLLAGQKQYSGCPGEQSATRRVVSGWDASSFRVMALVKGEAFSPEGKAVPHRQQPMNFQPENWASSAVHETPSGNGGARISGPRPNISTMTMAAPHSGQTNIGWTSVAETSGSAVSGRGIGATCNNARTFARFSRRPPLASKPKWRIR